MDIDERYEFLDKVGSGSFATVYRARDLELGREVAVKQIHQQYTDDPEQLARYWEEAQLLASLHHPNIVTIFDIYRERGWLILELMQTNLAERMAGRQMDLRALRTAIAHSLRALKYLHSRGIIHGDIKPSNLMIDARRRVKLGDFGLARRVSDDEGSLLKGTTKYMAPETVSDEFGDIGPASDLYSLGFTAYELMCGPNFETLFPGLSAFGRNKQVAWMMWHAAADRKLPEINRVLEGVPEDLQHVIQKLCEKDQSKRYSSADDALSDLKIDIKIVNKGEPETDESDAPQKMDPERRKRLLLAGAALVASLIVCIVILFIPKKEDKKPGVRYWKIAEIDVDQRKLTLVEFHGEHADIKSVPRDAIINLTYIGKQEPVPFEKLRVGDRVTLLKVRDDGKTILDMEVARPVVDRGKDVQVRQQDKVFLVSLIGKRSGERLTLRIPEHEDKYLTVLRNVSRKEWETATADERKMIEKLNAIRLSSIKPQDTVEFYHLPDVNGGRGRVLSGLIFVYRTQTRSGLVVEKNLPKRILTVQFTDETRKALEVAANATIERLGRDGNRKKITFEEINVNDRVTVKFVRTFDEILVKESEETRGTLVRLGQSGKQMIVRLAADNSEVTFRIDDAADVYIASEAAKVNELRYGDEVTVLYHTADDRKTAIEISAAKRVRRDRRAVVVGVSTFEDQTLPGLRYSSENAALLSKVLVNRYGVERETGRLVRLDERPRMESIRKTIEDTLSRSGDGIQVIIYLSTHAFVVDNKVYLAGWDLDSKDIAKTGWPLDDLLQKMEQCTSKDKILLLDISHQWDSKPPAPQPSAAAMMQLSKVPLKSTVVIVANSGDERGAFHKKGTNSAFAWYLAEAFRGAADADENMKITSDELWAFLSRQMKNADLSTAGTQTPARFPKP